LIRITLLDLSNNPNTRRVYSLTFIVDIEEEEEEEEEEEHKNKIKVNFYSKNKRWFYKLDDCSIYSLTLTSAPRIKSLKYCTRNHGL